jgi:hypothetical protein
MPVFVLRDAGRDRFQALQFGPLTLHSHSRPEFEMDTRCHSNWPYRREKRRCRRAMIGPIRFDDRFSD